MDTYSLNRFVFLMQELFPVFNPYSNGYIPNMVATNVTSKNIKYLLDVLKERRHDFNPYSGRYFCLLTLLIVFQIASFNPYSVGPYSVWTVFIKIKFFHHQPHRIC